MKAHTLVFLLLILPALACQAPGPGFIQTVPPTIPMTAPATTSSPDAPLLFDRDSNPKPAYQALQPSW